MASQITPGLASNKTSPQRLLLNPKPRLSLPPPPLPLPPRRQDRAGDPAIDVFLRSGRRFPANIRRFSVILEHERRPQHPHDREKKKSKHCQRRSTSMSSSAVTPALPLLPVARLDGESGYLRWKESVMLRLHTLGLAHVLSERPAAGEKHRARDDALCRGHILVTLSDRLLPAYAHHATAGAVWRATARTYDLDMEKGMSSEKARTFWCDKGKPLLEQLALLQALATVGETSDPTAMAYYIATGGFPPEVVEKVAVHGPHIPFPRMEEIWEIAPRHVMAGRQKVLADSMLLPPLEIDHPQHTTDGEESSSSSDDLRPVKRERPWDR